jgi:hypothetical protein
MTAPIFSFKSKRKGRLLGTTLAGALMLLGACSTSTTDESTTDAGSGQDGATCADGGSTGTGACGKDPSTAANAAAVYSAAVLFQSKLTATQQTAVQLPATLAGAQQWSNLPTSFVKRNGVALLDMDATAAAAALSLAAVAASGTGSTLLAELRAADEYLVTNGGAKATDYGAGRYYFSFIGTPSTTTPWMLQVAGHHLAYNFSYNSKCVSATPLFDAVEPTSWTDAAAHAPLEKQRAALVALIATLTATQEAKLSGTYSDLITGPPAGQGDTKFPSALNYPTGTTGRGVRVSTLSAAQQALVKTAIEAWVKNAADPVAQSLLASYESTDALANTYVGYSGAADLTTQSSYVRIDGPRVWIEFTVQGGIVYRNQVHFHTIWRDKAADYGAEYN